MYTNLATSGRNNDNSNNKNAHVVLCQIKQLSEEIKIVLLQIVGDIYFRPSHNSVLTVILYWRH